MTKTRNIYIYKIKTTLMRPYDDGKGTESNVYIGHG